MKESVFDRPLPDAIEAERLILGAALSDSEAFPRIAAILRADDFSLEKHKRIFLRVSDVYERGDPISSITVFHELEKHKQSESVDGLSYLLTLTDGLPTLPLLENMCQVVLDKAILRRTIQAAHTLTKHCFDAQDRPGDLLADAEAIIELITRSSVRRFNARTVAEIISDEGGINAFLSPDSRPGIHVPFPAIHETLSGLRRSKLILLDARPGTGKTALAVQISEHAASNGNNVVFISLEMNCRELLHRSIASRARVSSYKFRTGRLTQEERARVRDQASELTDLQSRLVQVDEPETTVPYIAALLRSLKAQQQPADLYTIHYLQLLSSVGRFENRVQEVAAMSRGLKRIARAFDIPVLALSQLTRPKNGGVEEPQLHELKESSQLEADADHVLFLWHKNEPARRRHDARNRLESGQESRRYFQSGRSEFRGEVLPVQRSGVG